MVLLGRRHLRLLPVGTLLLAVTVVSSASGASLLGHDPLPTSDPFAGSDARQETQQQQREQREAAAETHVEGHGGPQHSDTQHQETFVEPQPQQQQEKQQGVKEQQQQQQQ
eukprot:Rhum_TRINITY_DN14576_c34_g1::Rhum_TRINITY_DN14576_c34_g1_i1::g.94127::m.94127